MATAHASKPKIDQHVTRHVPLRRCVVCRKQRPQAELVRFYRDSEGQWQLDLHRKAGGRGAWVCALADAGQPACTQASLKTLQRFFRGQAGRVYNVLQADVLQMNVTGERCPS